MQENENKSEAIGGQGEQVKKDVSTHDKQQQQQTSNTIKNTDGRAEQQDIDLPKGNADDANTEGIP